MGRQDEAEKLTSGEPFELPPVVPSSNKQQLKSTKTSLQLYIYIFF